ncbi:helix-turn-helix transcriptional regulator [Leptolyngbya sp. 'hensonii']|uniref:helix-turn-helix domain-containing protein n=1 Tax=Leptolyngbya sp. 'hensonii' TaxID=1922337 RepID=UPI00209A99C6|nr:helix-turn-helix transcriptional regulator [Leptolyngbya sp. 'hensonii']
MQQSSLQEVVLTFAEIESLLGGTLPDSARRNRGWWSNRNQGALQAMAWMTAGYLVEDIDFEQEQVTFRKPTIDYEIRRVGDTVLWNGLMVRALRRHMNLTQAQFAQQLGVRQQTVSEWEKGVYAPTRATSKHLSLVADQARFQYDRSES